LATALAQTERERVDQIQRRVLAEGQYTAARAVELVTDYVRGVQRAWDRVKGGAS
jgi:hypothetical protein